MSIATATEIRRETWSAAERSPLPPLQSGGRLTRDEFERRYRAMPDVKKAELIEGVVYMPSPVSNEGHATPHVDLSTIFGVYRSQTPGVQAGDNVTIRLDLDNEPQPDLYQRSQMRSEVAAVLLRVILNVERERAAIDQAGVFGKQTEQHTHEKPFEFVAVIAASIERVVQLAQQLHGLDVDVDVGSNIFEKIVGRIFGRLPQRSWFHESFVSNFRRESLSRADLVSNQSNIIAAAAHHAER